MSNFLLRVEGTSIVDFSGILEIIYSTLVTAVIGPFRIYHFILMFLVVFLWMRANRNSYTVSHILLSDEKKAKRVKRALLESAKEAKTEQDLADLFALTAEKISECTSADKMGMLGTLGPGTMVDPFDRICWECDIGTVQGPVKTPYGYHLIFVHKRNTDEDTKAKIR